MRSCGIHLKTISHGIFNISILHMILKITILSIQTHQPGANELITSVGNSIFYPNCISMSCQLVFRPASPDHQQPSYWLQAFFTWMMNFNSQLCGIQRVDTQNHLIFGFWYDGSQCSICSQFSNCLEISLIKSDIIWNNFTWRNF